MRPKVVGTRVRPLDWDAKTAGTARYAADARPEGTLVGRILRSPYPHARIVRLDVDRASRVPGVRAVVTHRDLAPGVVYEHSGEPYSDRPPLAVDRVAYVGQEVAAVAADTAEAAERALRLIDVRYRRLRPVLSTAAALAARATRVRRREGGDNVALAVSGVWGSAELARSRSTVTVGGSFDYPRVTHACMEPNTTLAWWHDDRLELWTSTQASHFVVHELARVLGLRLDQVVCRDVAVGGGFGSKSKVSEHEAIAGLLSMRSGRPVLVELTRAEEISATKPRHAFRTTMRAHADDTGRIRWFEAEVDVDNGAFNHYGPSVMRAGIKQIGSLYRPDAVSWSGRLIDTNLTPGGQFRGYGAPQTALAIECLVDELAERTGIDPIEFRIRNANEPGSVAPAGARIGSARLVECLESVRELIGWDEHRRDRHPSRGLGVAVGVHASGSYAYPGGNVSAAGIDVTSAGEVVVRFGGSDAGTGQRTILGQIAAEVLDVPIGRVQVIMNDWDEAPPDMGAWSSRGTHMGGHAVKRAAEAMAERLRALGAEKLGTEDVRLCGGRVEAAGAAVDIGELVALAPESADGRLRIDTDYLEERMEPYWTGIPNPNISPSYTFAAHAVQVEVDEDTGEIRILDYVAAHDIGRAIHPGMVEGQIIGGVVQGLGAVLGENLIYEGGRVVNASYLHYPLPRSTTAPSIRAVLIEGPEEAGPYDAKSVGEMSIVPPAPAVLNAVYDAVGIRFHSLPLTPDVVLRALAEKRGAPRRRHHLFRRPGRWQIELFRRLYPLGMHAILHRFGTSFARRRPPRPVRRVVTPASVPELTAALAGEPPGEVAVVGAGTDLTTQRAQGLANPHTLVSVTAVTALRRLHARAGGVEIGAAVTLTELARWARDRIPMLADAVETIASAQIRDVATVGGNLAQAKRCWFFRNGFDCYKRGGATCPCYAVTGDHRFHHAAVDAHRCQAVTPSDLATVFAALDATVRVGDRHVPIGGLYRGPGELRIGPGEFIESVSLPEPGPERRGVFEKLRLWDGDFAVVSLALDVGLDAEGRWHRPRIVYGALAPVPWRPAATERALDGRRPTETELTTLIEREFERRAHPLSGTAWKLDAAAGLLRRAARRLNGDTPEGGDDDA
ncbi:molybdopterin cofactor-binding domain-containing protein [Rhizohabitans arisaemae]|uniref:molybdopterin cofactor-binding domain-containing protein n=1 Tax=Rhizohabitans arisaemae TaxID=2720610 RepID=UPI0024B12CEF|nr:molybdopterin cofactor-binding domain-containing protein [Rhizohabitans arisaemae]